MTCQNSLHQSDLIPFITMYIAKADTKRFRLQNSCLQHQDKRQAHRRFH